MPTLPAPTYPAVIAHRCGGVHAPENTLAGLKAAAALGIRGVEFDVMLCADGTPVLMHDETLERTTNGAGRVADTPLDVLQGLDAGGGEAVPTLEQAAELCCRLGLWANVEIKPAAGFEAATGETVARLARRFWPTGVGVLLSSFSPLSLEAARHAAPGLPRALLLERVGDDWRQRLEHTGCVALHAAWRGLTAGRVRELGEAGIPLACYTVNAPDVARRLSAWGVAALFSDRPETIAQAGDIRADITF